MDLVIRNLVVREMFIFIFSYINYLIKMQSQIRIVLKLIYSLFFNIQSIEYLSRSDEFKMENSNKTL